MALHYKNYTIITLCIVVIFFHVNVCCTSISELGHHRNLRLSDPLFKKELSISDYDLLKHYSIILIKTKMI